MKKIIIAAVLLMEPQIGFSSTGASQPAPTVPLWLQESTDIPAENAWRDLRAQILDDKNSRISADFRVPATLRLRTEFWFDIYTKYGENHHVIHHVRYPWIVYKVIDTTEMINTGKGPLWLRKDRANKFVKSETAKIRSALAKLAKKSSYKKLTGLEKELHDKLTSVAGSRKTVFRQAKGFVRSQLGQRDFFRKGLVNSSKYLPYMEATFAEKGLPIELTRMPFVESSFNEAARSKVGASGIWQIMPRTGKSYMIVNDSIDERNAPLKATQAAARLLRSYNRSLKSWPLTIISYNHGIGNIQKAIRKAGSRDLATIIARYHDGDFKFASSNFYTCFLAALHAERYHELLFNDVIREPLQERDVLKLSSRVSIDKLIKITGLTKQDLLNLNLDLKATLDRRQAYLPKGFELHLPTGVGQRLNHLGQPKLVKFQQTNI